MLDSDSDQPREFKRGIWTYRAAKWSKEESEERTRSAVRLFVSMAIDAVSEKAQLSSAMDASVHDEIATLPNEITVKVFAHYSNLSTREVNKMIRQNLVTHRILNPAAKRQTHKIPTWELRKHLGMPYSKS